MTLKTVIKVSILLIVAFIIYHYTVVSQMPIQPIEVQPATIQSGDVQTVDTHSVDNTSTGSISDQDGMALLKKFETADFDQLLMLYRPDLDGAYAEGYGAAIYRGFKKIGTKSSISKLSASPEKTRSGVLKYLASEVKISEESIAIEALKKELQSLNRGSKLNANEKGVVDTLLKTLD